mmetsp:Transcript_146483/g.380825  ORF Transcript_146483/g.380825 Transcript_146483/m.380825 type:complete len:208 (-) Transcript_146483:359-982(-)
MALPQLQRASIQRLPTANIEAHVLTGHKPDHGWCLRLLRLKTDCHRLLSKLLTTETNIEGTTVCEYILEVVDRSFPAEFVGLSPQMLRTISQCDLIHVHLCWGRLSVEEQIWQWNRSTHPLQEGLFCVINHHPIIVTAMPILAAGLLGHSDHRIHMLSVAVHLDRHCQGQLQVYASDSKPMVVLGTQAARSVLFVVARTYKIRDVQL